MKKNLTELVFILDRSGSMSGLEGDTIGGYNAMLEKQKKVEGEALVTTVLFDDQYELLHDRINLRGVAPITNKIYYVRGSTALLDAIGKTIDKIGHAHKHTAYKEVPEKTIVVITTDGQENASHEYSLGRIKSMIEHQKERYGWEFLFLGANIDAVNTAGSFGIAPTRAAQYHADRRGMKVSYESVDKAIECLRSSAPLGDDWKANIDNDFCSRQSER